MPRRGNTGYQSLESGSTHDVDEVFSTHDIGDALITPGKGTLHNEIYGSGAGTNSEFLGDSGIISSDSGLTAASPAPAKPQAQFETDNEASFISKKQTKQLLRKQFFRWLVTAFFIALIFLTLEVYQSKGYMTGTQKAIYNALITGLSLGLGLNFFEAFKDLAKVLRWWILSRNKHSVREVDLILAIENVSTVVKLGWESFAKRGRLLFCISWILVILIAQISVALINLTATINDGTDYNGTYTRPGAVNASDLACYFTGQTCPGRSPTSVQEVKREQEEVKQARAHIDGELAHSALLSAGCGHYNNISDVINSKIDYGYFCRRTRGKQEFAYRFSEYNPMDQEKRFPHFTQRVITASAGSCFQYRKSKGPRQVKDKIANLEAWFAEFTNGTFSSNMTIPMAYESISSTTYVYRGVNVPQLETTYACGPRCIRMWAHRAARKANDAYDQEAYFECQVNISDVMNATIDDHHVPDHVARLAASAIGLQGRSAQAGGHVWTQYQLYPYGSAWETHGESMDKVGANMAEFALGSLSTLFNTAPQIQIPGTVPYLGSRLQVFWPYAISLLIAIASAHLVIAFSVIWFTRHIIVKDDSNLVVARLMRPVVERLGDSGTLLDGATMSRAVHLEDGLVYGPRATETAGSYYLGLATHISPLTSNGNHPDGTYR